MEFITNRKPPPGRVGKCDGPFEQHLLEAAVMLALSQWLFTLGAEEVTSVCQKTPIMMGTT